MSADAQRATEKPISAASDAATNTARIVDAAWTEKGHKTWVELEAVESRKPFLSGGEKVYRTLGAAKAARNCLQR